MQRIKRSTCPTVFSSYFRIIDHVHDIWFSKHTFKRTRWFLKICKIFDKLSRPKMRELISQYGRKNLVTTTFLERKAWKKSLIPKDERKAQYSIWLLLLGLLFVVFCCIKSVCCIKLFIVLNPFYFQFQEFFI